MKVHMVDASTQGAPAEIIMGTADIKEELIEQFKKTLETGEGPTPAIQLGPTVYEVNKIGQYPSGTHWFAIEELEGEMKIEGD